MSCECTRDNVSPPAGYSNIGQIPANIKNTQSSVKRKFTKTQNNMSFSSYKEASEYAKKLVQERQKPVSLVEGDRCWIVRVK